MAYNDILYFVFVDLHLIYSASSIRRYYLIRLAIFEPAPRHLDTWVSSAYKVAFAGFKYFSKSFIFTMNRRRPKQDPWGIPHMTASALDSCNLSLQYCFLFRKYDCVFLVLLIFQVRFYN